VNDFDELIGADVAVEERERLRGVHELLVEAGPPPELPTALENVPAPARVRRLPRQSVPRKIALIAAAIILLAVTFGVGFTTGKSPASKAQPAETLALSGTKAAPHAAATLDVSAEVAGNYPMTLEVSGLPQVTAPQYYTVWLVRNGKPWGSCGQFVVSKRSRSLMLALNAPYALEKGDTWIVTRDTFGKSGAGPTVLRPA
jgi:hypothetical protein